MNFLDHIKHCRDKVRFWPKWKKECIAPPEGFEPVQLKEMSFKDGHFTLDVKHPRLVILAEALAEFFKDAQGMNYVSMNFWDKDLGTMEMVVQKCDGKTPAQLHQELLMAVESKHPGQTRHETALMYIKQAKLGQDRPQAAREG